MPRMTSSAGGPGGEPGGGCASVAEFSRKWEVWRDVIGRELANRDLWEGCPEGTADGVQTLLKVRVCPTPA
eukprot:412906-Prorocentrum_minimum.AAC.1